MKSRRRNVICALAVLFMLISPNLYLYHHNLDFKNRYLNYRQNIGECECTCSSSTGSSTRTLTSNGTLPQKHVTIIEVNADPPAVLQTGGSKTASKEINKIDTNAKNPPVDHNGEKNTAGEYIYKMGDQAQVNTNIVVEEGTGNQCKPSTHIVFLKTHKTGSSTLTSIFQRFGFSRNLSFVMPSRGHVINGGGLFKQSYAGPGRYDMLVNHVRYNRKEMDAVMKPDTKYITILRDPATQAESVFGYFQLFKPLNLSKDTNPFEKFISRPQYYMDKYSTFKMRNYLKNPSLYDLGFEQSNLTKVHSYIDTISREFDLVLLQEYFNESLLLLKKRLCWNLDDILYIIKGLRINSLRFGLSASLKTKSREWNSADAELYDFFNATFWKTVADYGPDFKTDLKILEDRLNETFYECTMSDNKPKVDHRAYTFKINPVSGTTCKHMLLSDAQFTSTIRKSVELKRRKLTPPKGQRTIPRSRRRRRTTK